MCNDYFDDQRRKGQSEVRAITHIPCIILFATSRLRDVCFKNTQP